MNTFMSDGNNQQQAVMKKYSSTKFGGVARQSLSF